MINYFNIVANQANHKSIDTFLKKNLEYKNIKRVIIRTEPIGIGLSNECNVIYISVVVPNSGSDGWNVIAITDHEPDIVYFYTASNIFDKRDAETRNKIRAFFYSLSRQGKIENINKDL
jgi:hypothetical protein